MLYWFLYDSSCVIKECHINSSTSWRNLNGYAGALSAPLADTTAQDAYNNPQNYTVENGVLVMTATPAQLLFQAQNKQIAVINQGLNATLVGGFASKSTGHTYVTTTNGQTNMEGDLKRFELDTSLTSVQFYTIDAGWIAHTQSELQSAFLDGGKWKDAQYAQAQNLIAQVNAQTSIPATPVTWTPATY